MTGLLYVAGLTLLGFIVAVAAVAVGGFLILRLTARIAACLPDDA